MLSPRNKYASKAKALLARPLAGSRAPILPKPVSLPIAGTRAPLLPARRPPSAVPTATPHRPPAPAYPSIYAPLNPAQIQAQAQADTYGPYNSIIDATVNGLLGKAAYQSDAERAQTSRLMAALAPYAAKIRGYAEPMAQGAMQTGQAIGAQQSALGGQLQGELGAKLGGIQAPGQAVSQVAGGANQIGQGAAGAIGALGSAEYGRLHGVGEANAQYAGAQPGIAQLESLARLGLIQQDLSGNLASQIGDLQIEAQRAYMDRLDKLQGLEYSKAEQRQQYAASAKSAKQDALDRQMEGVALKLSYGMKLTPRESYLLNHYGLSSSTANTLISTKASASLAKNEAKWKAAAQAADNAAAAARQAQHDAAAAQRQAQHDAQVAAQHRGDAVARAKAQRSKDAAAMARQHAKDAAAMARQKAKDKAAMQRQRAKAKSGGKGGFLDKVQAAMNQPGG